MRYFILGHQGLGDHILMNGFVHHILQTVSPEEICIIAMNDYRRATLEHLYSDFPIVSFYWVTPSPSWVEDSLVRQLHHAKWGSFVEYQGKTYSIYNFGVHSEQPSQWLLPTKSWIESFYLGQAKLNPMIRFLNFQTPIDLSRAWRMYSSVIEKLQGSKYILVHDDPSRQRNMDLNKLQKILAQDGMLDYPILYLGFQRYKHPLFSGYQNPTVGDVLTCDSILDYSILIHKAAACHFMDSSISCLTDMLQPQSKLYLHSYMVSTTQEPYGKIYDPSRWTYT